eukprot:1375217-Pyramimonas_sp.AAC.1
MVGAELADILVQELCGGADCSVLELAEILVQELCGGADGQPAESAPPEGEPAEGEPTPTWKQLAGAVRRRLFAESIRQPTTYASRRFRNPNPTEPGRYDVL